MQMYQELMPLQPDWHFLTSTLSLDQIAIGNLDFQNLRSVNINVQMWHQGSINEVAGTSWIHENDKELMLNPPYDSHSAWSSSATW